MQGRFPSISPLCANCATHEEDANHLLHQCQFARACFLLGPLGLMTDALSGCITQVFQGVSDSLDDEQWLLYVNSAWALWRCRNDQVYGGKQPDFIQFRYYLYSINWESKLGATSNFGVIPGRGQQAEFYCYSDGSWEEGWYGGVGVVMWHKDEMIFYKSKAVRGCCPLQVEAIALKEPIASAITHGIVSCTFYSDCLTLVQTCSSLQPPIDADWRAFDEILEVWKLLQENKSFVCVHVH